jgi:hypothetical protein
LFIALVFALVGAVNIAAFAGSGGETLAAPPAQTFPTPTNTPINTPTNTPIPPKITPTFTPVPPALGSITGVVTLDGNPASGFSVRLEGRSTGEQTTGLDGTYSFKNLPAGTYVVRVAYDPQKVAPVGQDFSDLALASDTTVRRDFQFKSLAQPTTVAPPGTTPPVGGKPGLEVVPASGKPGTLLQINGTGWKPLAPDGTANIVTVILDNSVNGQVINSNRAPLVTLGSYQVDGSGKFQGQATLPDLAPQQVRVIGTDRNAETAQSSLTIQPANTPTAAPPTGVQCSNPSPPSGNGLRIAVLTARNGNGFAICVQAVAGDFDVDLSHTVIVTLPPGTTVTRTQPSTGSASTNGNTASWDGFNLVSRATATLILQVTTPDGNLNSANVTVTGRATTGNFRRIIPGLPPLTEIDFDVPQGGTGPVPSSLPSTGSANQPDEATSLYPVLAAIAFAASGVFLTIGLIMSRRERRR